MAAISLESVPAYESCAQVGTEGYDIRAQAECRAYASQLTRLHQAKRGQLPAGIKLKVAPNAHDFGTYYDVKAVYDENDDAAVLAACWLEEHMPVEWDDEARKELGLNPWGNE